MNTKKLPASDSNTVITNPISPAVVAAWKAADEPAGADYQEWAMEYYRTHSDESQPTKNDQLAQALGLQSVTEHFTCRIF